MCKIAVGQMCCQTGNIELNLEKINNFSIQAVREGAQLIVFPELAVHGYRMDGDFTKVAEKMDGGTVTKLKKISKDCGIWMYITVPEEKKGGLPYNTAVLISPQGLEATYRKIHLWKKEKEFFSPGNRNRRALTPVGMAGLMICFDISYPEPARTHASQGCDVLLYSMAFSPVWRGYALDLFSRTRALENGCFAVISNHTGLEEDTLFAGNSCVVAPDGKVLDKMNMEEGIICTELDQRLLKETREQYPYLKR